MEEKQQDIKQSVKLEEALTPTKGKSKKSKICMVDGIFKNWEVRGAPITFSYFSRSLCGRSGVSKKYTLEDGKKYTLPLEVAKHINRCSYPVSDIEIDKHGRYLGKHQGIVRRYTFRRIDDLMDN